MIYVAEIDLLEEFYPRSKEVLHIDGIAVMEYPKVLENLLHDLLIEGLLEAPINEMSLAEYDDLVDRTRDRIYSLIPERHSIRKVVMLARKTILLELDQPIPRYIKG